MGKSFSLLRQDVAGNNELTRHFVFHLELHKQFTQALPFTLYESYNRSSLLLLSDAGIVVLFKENGAVVLPETVGQKHSDHQITSRFRPSLCARKTGRNMMR